LSSIETHKKEKKNTFKPLILAVKSEEEETDIKNGRVKTTAQKNN